MQDPGKAVQIKSMGAGQHCKIGLCPAGYTLKRLRKGSAKHGIRSGGAQLLGKFLPVIYGKHWHAEKLCLLYKGSSNMTAAADCQLRHRTKALSKYPLPVQCKKARSGTGLQDGKLTLQKFGTLGLPQGVSVPQQQLTACLCAFQHGSQRIAAGLVCTLQNVCKRLSVHGVPLPLLLLHRRYLIKLCLIQCCLPALPVLRQHTPCKPAPCRDLTRQRDQPPGHLPGMALLFPLHSL